MSEPSGLQQVDMRAILEQWQAKVERWHAHKRIGRVGYDADTDTIAFYWNDEDDNDNYYYWFYAKHVKHPRGQMEWIMHMNHKNWFTREVFTDFLDVLQALGYATEGISLSTEP